MALPQIIAHRGGREWAPENTLSAFRKAIEFGAPAMEFDVQRCSTGELVVFHDEDLARTTNGVGLIKDCSLDELRRLDAGSWFDRQFKGEKIPLLKEVLDLVAGKCELHIELKNAPIEYPGIEQDLLDVLQGYPQETVIISSFDHQLMVKLNMVAPQLRKAVLAEAILIDLKGVATSMGAGFFNAGFDSLRADVVADAQAQGLKVNAWTINTPQKWRQAVQARLDGIITDDPEGLRGFLQNLQAISPQSCGY